MMQGSTIGEWVITQLQRVRLWAAFLVAALLFVATDLAVLRLERVPGLVLRNEGRTHLALPYMFRQMSLTKDRPVVAFLGASEIQGIMNATAAGTAPMIAQKIFDEKGIRARCFNLAAIGNNLGDNYAVATEAVRNGANIIAVPLHFKLFSSMGSLNFMTCYKETTYYLRDIPGFTDFRRRELNVSDREYQDVQLEKFVESWWAFYRERRLITYLMMGDEESIPAHFRTWIFNLVGVPKPKPDSPVWNYDTPEKRNVDNLWLLQPEAYHKNNAECYSKVNISRDDIHFRMLEKINELSSKKKVKILIYMVPLNRTAAEQHHYFDWKRHEQFKKLAEDMARGHGNFFADLTDAVDNRYFSDGDHLNMNGHAQMGAALAGAVEKVLEGAAP